MKPRVAAWVLVAGLALAGCGRYGPPVRPSAVPPSAPDEEETLQPTDDEALIEDPGEEPPTEP
jgi:hypothetical protein